MKKILVLHTGGTISMQADQDGQVNSSEINPMTQLGLDLADTQIDSLDFLNVPSPHITTHHMMALYQKIKAEQNNYDAFVITHGTDTLEETAYFLDTMAIPDKPIVLTGAMRSSNELGSDGVYNYLSALRVASHQKSKDKGVLVVMNDEIHAAKYVTKTHTTNVSTFQTPTHGPLGIIMKQDILYFKTAEPRVRFDLDSISGTVPIIKAYAGMSDGIISLLSKDTVDGVVIEALGAGNLPPQAALALENLMADGVPVVLVSRCFNGIAEAVYGYEGGGVRLAEKGVMFVKELNAQKARLKLLIAINAGLDEERVDAVLSKSLELGINFFDHADIYAKGESERAFAQGMKRLGISRDKILLQSKCGIRSGCFDFSKEHIISSVEGILERLETDYLDILALHRPDALMEVEEVADAFYQLRQAGKVRYFGVSNQNPFQMELLSQHLDQPLAVNQVQLSPAHTPMIDVGLQVNMKTAGGVDRDNGILDYCQLKKITPQAWSPFQVDLAQGPFMQHPDYQNLVTELERLSEVYGVSSEALVLAWILRHPAKMQTIVGSMNPERLERMAQATNVTLSREDWYSIYRSAGNILP